MENFAQLLQENLSAIQMEPGAVLDCTIIEINRDKNIVVVSTPLKSEGYIRIDEFRDQEGKLDIEVGQSVPLALEMMEDGWGETRLSRSKAKRQEVWGELERAHEAGAIINGYVSGKVKGGFTVDVNGVRAFLPGSLLDVRPVKDTRPYEKSRIRL